MPRDDAEAAKTELEALNKVDLAAALATFDAPWEPRIVAALKRCQRDPASVPIN